MVRERSVRVGEIPAYGFYGEAVEPGFPDLLFVERLAERSARHGWTIEAHRHPNLVQVFLLKAGAATVDLDGRVLSPRLPALLFLPTQAVHGFRFARDSEGLVLTVPAGLVEAVMAGDPGIGDRFRRPWLSTDRSAFAAAWQRGDAIEAVYRGRAPGRRIALQALTALLLLDLAAALPGEAAPAAPPDPARDLADRLEREIDARFRAHPTVGELAASLGVGRSRLTRAARTILGRSPQRLVHDRLILEARRDLAYSVKSVAAIAHSLGFQDPAYFARFFKRRVGRTPLADRRRALAAR